MNALTTIELLYDAGLLAYKKWEKDGRLYVESCGDDCDGDCDCGDGGCGGGCGGEGCGCGR